MQLSIINKFYKCLVIRPAMAMVSIGLLVSCSPAGTAPERIANEKPALVAPACLSKPDAGKCRAAIRRFYFDEKSGQCQMFFWGGCEGRVPFKTLAQCQNSCEL